MKVGQLLIVKNVIENTKKETVQLSAKLVINDFMGQNLPLVILKVNTINIYETMYFI